MKPIDKKRLLLMTENVPFPVYNHFDDIDDMDMLIDEFVQEIEPKAPANDTVRDNHPENVSNN